MSTTPREQPDWSPCKIIQTLYEVITDPSATWILKLLKTFRMSYTGETHIPLQKGIDDCVTGENTTLTAAVSSPTGINNGGLTRLPRLIESSNPDLIPVQARGQMAQN